MRLLVPIIILLFPILAFWIAGVNELRSDRGVGYKVRCLIPIVVGTMMYILAWGPKSLLHLSTPFPSLNSRLIAMIFAIIASSGAFMNYSRRSSSILIALGGLELTFISIFFSHPIV